MLQTLLNLTSFNGGVAESLNIWGLAEAGSEISRAICAPLMVLSAPHAETLRAFSLAKNARRNALYPSAVISLFPARSMVRNRVVKRFVYSVWEIILRSESFKPHFLRLKDLSLVDFERSPSNSLPDRLRFSDKSNDSNSPPKPTSFSFHAFNTQSLKRSLQTFNLPMVKASPKVLKPSFVMSLFLLRSKPNR